MSVLATSTIFFLSSLPPLLLTKVYYYLGAIHKLRHTLRGVERVDEV